MKFKATLFFSLLSIVLIPPTISKRVERDEAEELDYSIMSSVAGLFTLDDRFICSGVFITKRHIITAEDCVNLSPLDDNWLKVVYSFSDDFGAPYATFEDFDVHVDVYRNELVVIRLSEELDVIPISLISEDELKEAIVWQENAICGEWKDFNKPLTIVGLLPENNCVQAHSNLLLLDDRYNFNTNLHFCFQPMNCFQQTFYGGPLFINGKLAGIKVHNYRNRLSSLYMKISNLEEISDIISIEERPVNVIQWLGGLIELIMLNFYFTFSELFTEWQKSLPPRSHHPHYSGPLFEIDVTFHPVSLAFSNYQKSVLKYIQEPLLNFNLTTQNNLIEHFTFKIFLGADIPTSVDYIMFAGTANAIGFKFNTSSEIYD